MITRLPIYKSSAHILPLDPPLIYSIQSMVEFHLSSAFLVSYFLCLLQLLLLHSVLNRNTLVLPVSNRTLNSYPYSLLFNDLPLCPTLITAQKARFPLSSMSFNTDKSTFYFLFLNR